MPQEKENPYEGLSGKELEDRIDADLKKATTEADELLTDIRKGKEKNAAYFKEANDRVDAISREMDEHLAKISVWYWLKVRLRSIFSR